MSKGNIFMGVARGKVGDLVLYRKNGEQISRVRVRKIGNPRTQAQMIQRIFMATTSRAYSALQAVCDHSFQGKSGVLENMSRFTTLNIAMMKEAYNRAPSNWRGNVNYNTKDETRPVVGSYVISEGTLEPMTYVYDNSDTSIELVGNGQLTATPTYQQVVDYLGVQRGDQITFVHASVVEESDEATSIMGDVRMQRIILEPNDGDMTSPFIVGGAVNKPNPKNTGNLIEAWAIMEGALKGQFFKEAAAWSVILSRYDNKTWKRSPQTLDYNTALPNNLTLGNALDSWEQAASSSLYLNQAES